jgi:F0F1-type ATP synthase assembly protein I
VSQSENQQRIDTSFSLSLVWFAGQVGCLTLIIIAGAFFAGLWIDKRMDTAPWFMLIFLIGSVPVTMLVMYRAAKSAGARMAKLTPQNLKTSQEDPELGRDQT